MEDLKKEMRIYKRKMKKCEIKMEEHKSKYDEHIKIRNLLYDVHQIKYGHFKCINCNKLQDREDVWVGHLFGKNNERCAEITCREICTDTFSTTISVDDGKLGISCCICFKIIKGTDYEKNNAIRITEFSRTYLCSGECTKIYDKGIRLENKNKWIFKKDDMIIPHNPKCTVCGTKTKNVCQKCKGFYYCSVECQKKDWPNHKKICKREN